MRVGGVSFLFFPEGKGLGGFKSIVSDSDRVEGGVRTGEGLVVETCGR